MRTRHSDKKGGLYGAVPHRGLSGAAEYPTAAVRTANSKHHLYGPEHAQA